ncbi:hypothetical protein PAAG_07119 [Paracoccidioides lutzii Pb01]|uniref:Uncharacterized protein n=1 Tax=Paracoccidioides lutzii (strain ATCC MYA-826 / Pb01) TaxID=502779 RepID=C1H8M8_PARBA|nr:hypothetical protein PAAG_07119 [Paracoccidioides lutzii Pb01]EEH36701.1 hypothetical protein PAAG_07119 [Paracoccidioides lutzii Pb01]
MGPLMVSDHPSCLKSRKSTKSWNKYIKGASAVFAYHISRGEKITVLSPPPPDRFHPDGLTNYQTIEEPVLKGAIGGVAVSRIEMVHPTVKGAEDFYYQVWPADETHLWIANFGMLLSKKQHWRRVSSKKRNLVVSQAEVFIQTETKVQNVSGTAKALKEKKEEKKKREKKAERKKKKAERKKQREEKRKKMTTTSDTSKTRKISDTENSPNNIKASDSPKCLRVPNSNKIDDGVEESSRPSMLARWMMYLWS